MNPPSPVRTNTSADEMREQRNREAKELIGSRVDTAKAIFTQNSAASQLSNQKAAPIKPIRNSIAHRINTLNNQQQQQQPMHSYSPASSTEIEIISTQPIDNITTLPEPPSIISDAIETSAKIDEIAQLAETIVEPTAALQVLNIPDDDDADPYSTIKRSPYTKTGSISQVTSPDVEQTKAIEIVSSPVKNDNSNALKTVNNGNNDSHKGESATISMPRIYSHFARIIY